jgi:hypothetical protein
MPQRSSFAKYVRQEGLSCPEIIIEWLKTHHVVSSPQLVLETEGYYEREAFRASMWRMVRRHELDYTGFEGYYKLGSKPYTHRRILNPEEITELRLLAPFMPSYEQLAHLYGISRHTARKYVYEHLSSDTSRSLPC